MTLQNRLGGHTNSYHTYSLEEALEGIAAVGFRFVELSAVGQGHVDFAGIVNIFKQSNYRGPFTIEIEFYGEPWPPLADVNAAMKQSCQTL